MITAIPLDQDKLLAVMIYLTAKTKPTKFVLSKLIFLADYIHLAKYGRPVLGGHYHSMPQGPVPSEAYDVMKAIEAGTKPKGNLYKLGNMKKLFHVEDGEYPRLAVNSNTIPDLDTLSKSDIEVLDFVVQKYAGLTFDELWEYTHALPAYKRAIAREPDSTNAIMWYDDFFENNSFATPGSRDELMENHALSKAFPHRAL